MSEIQNIDRNELTVTQYRSADTNPALVYLAGLGKGSRRAMAGALDTIAQIVIPESDHVSFPWYQLRYQHTAAIRSELMGQYSTATINKQLSALRCVLRECWRLGFMSAEDYQRAADIKSVKKDNVSQSEKGRHLQTGEIASLINVCLDGTPAGARDAAILILAISAGFRRSELADLDIADIDLDECRIDVRDSKSGTRVVYANNSACDAVLDWLHFRGYEPGHLFQPISQVGVVGDGGMSDQSIYNIIKRRCEQAQVREFSTHDLRRTYAGNMLDAGVDIVTLQKLMGHASPETTASYDRRDARAKRDAANRLHVPYTRQYK